MLAVGKFIHRYSTAEYKYYNRRKSKHLFYEKIYNLLFFV